MYSEWPQKLQTLSVIVLSQSILAQGSLKSRGKLKYGCLDDTARFPLSPGHLRQAFYGLGREKSLSSFQTHPGWHVLDDDKLASAASRVDTLIVHENLSRLEDTQIQSGNMAQVLGVASRQG
jgi:hypothetical protein